jgi:hypothetical protein
VAGEYGVQFFGDLKTAGGEAQKCGAAVVGVGLAFEKATVLQAVGIAADAGPVDADLFGEPGRG